MLHQQNRKSSYSLIMKRNRISAFFKSVILRSLTGIGLMLVLLSTKTSANAQITGKLSMLTNGQIKLVGYNGFNTYNIDSCLIDKEGNFSLTYNKTDHGVGYFSVSKSNPIYLILNGEDIVLTEKTTYVEGQLTDYNILVAEGDENLLLKKYEEEDPTRETAYSAWHYLDNLYAQNETLKNETAAIKAINTEKARLRAQEGNFIEALDKKSYLKWFLPKRKLVSSVSTIAQNRTEEIPSAIEAFRALDYTDKRLYKSGLFKQSLEAHFWLIENGGMGLDSMYKQMNLSIDLLLNNLMQDEVLLNEVCDYLFDLLERKSLFTASEHLAIKVLTQQSCTLNNDLAKQLETYRAMQKGKIAPQIEFPTKVVYPNKSFKPTRLSHFKSDYTLVVFGASWCPKCNTEINQMAASYSNWKKNGVDVLFVSLDDDEAAFDQFTMAFPFVSICDLKKWESPIADDYYVSATPTMFLLDKNKKILLRPISAKQVDAWVNWFLVEGNQIPNN